MERAISRFEGTTLQLDPTSPRPLYVQLRDAIRQRILSGAYPPGMKLPATRALAATLSVSRNTVINAYESLAAEALVEGAIGSGTRVRYHRRKPKPLDVRSLLKESHFPNDPLPIRDPDGNPLYIHR